VASWHRLAGSCGNGAYLLTAGFMHSALWLGWRGGLASNRDWLRTWRIVASWLAAVARLAQYILLRTAIFAGSVSAYMQKWPGVHRLLLAINACVGWRMSDMRRPA